MAKVSPARRLSIISRRIPAQQLVLRLFDDDFEGLHDRDAGLMNTANWRVKFMTSCRGPSSW